MAVHASTPTRGFARPTEASLKRSTPKSTNAQDGGSTPSKLKRPARLLHPPLPLAFCQIVPADRRKPCLLAKLPSEIRLLVYEYALPQGPMLIDDYAFRNYRIRESISRPLPKKMRDLWPELLHVCRTIRTEAAYVFYMRTQFVGHISYLNFQPVKSWLGMIPLEHRSHLSKNRNIRLVLAADDYFPLPSSQIWMTSARFGSMYTINSERHRQHFLSFCRLASWWLWCARRPEFLQIKWNYDLEFKWHETTRNYASGMKKWLSENLLTVALPCVQEAWRWDRHEHEMKDEALRMLDGVDSSFKAVVSEYGGREIAKTVEDWDYKVRILKKFMGKW